MISSEKQQIIMLMIKLFIPLLILINTLASSHPLKMAYTAVKYNSQKEVFEIGHRIFQDDFEITLQKNYGYNGGDVFIHQNSEATRKAVNQFFDKNFKIAFNGTKLGHHYLRTEQKNEMGIIVWYETDKIKEETITTVSVFNAIMVERFKEQVNMFNLNINDKFKRTLKFTSLETKETIIIK